jgi:two-component system, OmpR family, sensor histidine kinase CpxA
VTRFFWRIFLSTWAVVLIASGLTVWVANLVPDGDSRIEGSRFTQQMIGLLAAELRRELVNNPATAVDTLLEEYVLDFSPVLEIYVVGPDGEDVLGRALPGAVTRYVEARANPSGTATPHPFPNLHIRGDGLNGYLIVGHEGFFPLGRKLMEPGIRWLLLVFALVASGAASLMLARFIVLPVRRLQLAGQQVATGDLTVRVAHTVGSRTDDIARLAHDFDVMTERVDQLLQSQQRLIRDVSHELRSPLARLQALLSIARQQADDTRAPQIDRMETEIERLNELIGEILTYSRLEAQDHISRHATDLVDLLQNILHDAELEGLEADKQLELDAPASLLLEVDSGLIQRAVENVIRNAVKYTGEGTTITVSIRPASDGIRIMVDDQGPGVPPDAIGRIFEPFYRVSDARSTQSGSGGVGLAIAERSIRLHGGSMTARNRDGGGLRIEIFLPSPNREPGYRHQPAGV